MRSATPYVDSNSTMAVAAARRARLSRSYNKLLAPNMQNNQSKSVPHKGAEASTIPSTMPKSSVWSYQMKQLRLHRNGQTPESNFQGLVLNSNINANKEERTANQKDDRKQADAHLMEKLMIRNTEGKVGTKSQTILSLNQESELKAANGRRKVLQCEIPSP